MANGPLDITFPPNGIPGGSSSSSSSSSTGGGNSTYSNLTGDFTATPNVGAKTITLSAYASSVLSSFLSARNFAAAVVKKIDSTGKVTDLPVTSVSFSSNVLTLTDMTANFAAGDQVAVLVPGPDKAFDETNDAAKNSLVTRLDPVNDALTNYPYGHPSTYISTAATTVIKTGSGVLQSIVVNGGTAGTIAIYDNTAGSGTLIASFDSTAALNAYLFNAAFATGLTIVTSAATKLTVTYR